MDDATTEKTSTLEATIKQFEDWRARRQRQERIPQHLWKAATDLCKTHPATHVCRSLRLSYSDLKKHMAADSYPAPVQFMQLELSSAAGPWSICCERADGSRLSLSANGPMPAIELLLQRFLA
jgi:hypothetical protein